MVGAYDSLLSSIIDSVFSSPNLRALLAETSGQLGRALRVSKCVISVYEPDSKNPRPPVEWSAFDTDPALDHHALALQRVVEQRTLTLSSPFVVSRAAEDFDLKELRSELELLDVRSLMAVCTRWQGVPNACIVVQQCKHERDWSEAEIAYLETISYFLGIAIAQHRQVEGLEAREEHYRQLVEGNPHAMLFFDQRGTLVDVSRQFLDISGLEKQAIIGSSFSAFFEMFVSGGETRKLIDTYQERLRGTPQSASLEYGIRHRDSGAVTWVHDRFSQTHDTNYGATGFQSTLIDVTDWYVGERRLRRSEDRYRRLVEHSDAIIFHSDSQHIITFISRRAVDFFGVNPEDFTSGEPVRWFELIHIDDRERVEQRVLDMQKAATSFDEEFRVVNQVTGRVRWLLTKLVPVRSDSGELVGWDGFGIEITKRREVQEALDVQSRKVRALYTVSSAIRGYLDPANIAARGLAALCDATEADAGLCYLYSAENHKQLALVAHHGFSADFNEKIESASKLPSLSTYVATKGQSVVVPDIRTDPRASRVLSEEEGVRSAVLVPITVEDEVLGTLGLFTREIAKFDGGDVMLVSAAANQIGLAARQASLFSAYRKQTKNLSALYRTSHELSRFLSTDEIFQQAFTILRDELGLKRLWLGLLNETGTRIIGQAAYGPGWKRQLVEMNVEISGREHPIAQVVTTRKPIIIEDPQATLQEFGLKRFFSRLAIESIALVPLISSGQVLGVLAVQPGANGPPLDQAEVTLLSSLANEIAAVMMAKRLEERIAEGEKMRTAGLLAAGIAHNFNNLLQAILGQASLLEMQRDNSEGVSRSAGIISEAATKGASLVKQLISFANLEEPSSEICDLNDVIERTAPSFSELLDRNQRLKLSLSEGLPRAYVDPRHVMRILSSLVTNAHEAMKAGGTVEVFSDSIVVDEQNPHYEVPYGRYVRVGVRDDGIGMDLETKRRCFEPFFTTKNVDPSSGLGMSGSGLGLSAAYALARKNGGRLVVDSRPGHGSVFTLYIPADELTAKEGRRQGEGQLTTSPGELVEPSPPSLSVEKVEQEKAPLPKVRRGNPPSSAAKQSRPTMPRK